MTFTKEEIKTQEEFVKAISYQKEVAQNAYHDARDYYGNISVKYAAERAKLFMMKENS